MEDNKHIKTVCHVSLFKLHCLWAQFRLLKEINVDADGSTIKLGTIRIHHGFCFWGKRRRWNHCSETYGQRELVFVEISNEDFTKRARTLRFRRRYNKGKWCKFKTLRMGDFWCQSPNTHRVESCWKSHATSADLQYFGRNVD